MKGTWGGKRKKNDIHIWIASDGSELVPPTDVQKNLTLLTLPGGRPEDICLAPHDASENLRLFWKLYLQHCPDADR
jgi:hypothetical protein